MLTPNQIAEIAHETNRVYCEQIGDYSQPVWAYAPTWQQESAINGVIYHFNNPDATPAASHANWLAEKIANGWVYGEEKDEEKKTHPCIMAYEELPEAQRIKDSLFMGVVKAFLPE